MSEEKIIQRMPDAKRLSKSGEHQYTRPKDAATLIILDRTDGQLRFLAGRRSQQHVFMPGLYVFPGGRLDRTDHSIAPADGLHDAVMHKLQLASGKRMTARRAAALGIAAIRETFEETGLAIGPRDVEKRSAIGFRPSLGNLRYIARAITPPGRVKRYDTRFFAVFADEVGVLPENAQPSLELERLEWVPLSRADDVKLPDITRAILHDLTETLDLEPGLPFGRPVPFYYVRNRRFVREEL